jgi:hypothetical protein
MQSHALAKNPSIHTIFMWKNLTKIAILNVFFFFFFLFYLFFKYPPWLLEVVESRNLWFWVAGKDYFSHFNLKVFLPLHASSAFVLLCFFHFL